MTPEPRPMDRDAIPPGAPSRPTACAPRACTFASCSRPIRIGGPGCGPPGPASSSISPSSASPTRPCATWSPSPTNATSPNAGPRCSPASASTSPRTARCCTSRCACPGRCAWRSTGTDVVAEVHAGARAHGSLRRPGALRRVERAHRQADQDGRQHRHRRLGPRSGDGLRGAAPVLRSRGSTCRFVSNVDADCHPGRHAGPRPRRDPVHRLLQDLHHPRDDDQRPLGAALADRRARRRGRLASHFVAVSTNTEAVAAFGIAPENMFGFWDWVGGRYSMDSAIGLSTMIAIGPRGVRASCWPGSTPWTSTSCTAPLEANLPVLMGLCGLVPQFPRRGHDSAVLPYEPVPAAVPRLPAAADDGVQRQARDASTGSRSTTTPARSSGASRAPTASTASTS